MLFIAHQLGIDAVGLENVGVLQRFAGQFVAVVGNQPLFLAEQFPVVAIRRAVEAADAVAGQLAIAVACTGVIGHGRRTAHAALAGNVLPGTARLLHLVQRFMDHGDFTGHP
ncbi:hypothetical protein D3C77_390350 [compost metagenome]